MRVAAAVGIFNSHVLRHFAAIACVITQFAALRPARFLFSANVINKTASLPLNGRRPVINSPLLIRLDFYASPPGTSIHSSTSNLTDI